MAASPHSDETSLWLVAFFPLSLPPSFPILSITAHHLVVFTFHLGISIMLIGSVFYLKWSAQ